MNWEQLQAIAWLRWRLTRNMFARAGTLNMVVSMIALVVLVLGGVAAGAGGFLAGALGLPKLQPQVLLVVWDCAVFVFLLFWLMGLVVEIQRSESIDLPKLLHLPVTLRQVFVFNYVLSHLTPGIVLLVPAMVGAGAGLVFGVGPRMAWLMLLVLTFVFMVSAWTYCLRGWLAALMTNKRRRRAVIVWITVVFILVAQLPNLLFSSSGFFGHRGRDRGAAQSEPAQGQSRGGGKPQLGEGVIEAHLAVPVGWVGYGAMTLREGTIWPAAAGVAASALIGVLGLMRAYKATLRFYQGADEGVKAAPKVARDANRRLLVERRLPWLREDTAALTMATLRSQLRAPELKMVLIVPVVMIVVVGSLNITKARQAAPYMGPLAAAGAAALATFSLVQTMSNVFGLDRNGFRALVLLPVRREQVLLAKNLALFPFAGAIGVIMLVLAALMFRMSPTVFLAGLLQIPAAFFLFSIISNLASMLTPYRLALGSLQAKKPKAVVMLSVFITMVLTPVLLAPVLLPAGLEAACLLMGWVPWLPVNLLGSVALLGGILAFYGAVLPAQGRLLRRREQAILKEVTEDVE
ncbi:MAG TPA: hypothetical protein VJA21_14405 [Verrucomicrobiae bacterium]